MIIKDINILEKSNFITTLLGELCRQNISYVLIEGTSNDNKKYLELHFDKYIYRFHEINYKEINSDFLQSPFEVFNEVSFNNNAFVDDSLILKEEKIKKKGKNGNKRYTKKDMRNDRNIYKTSKANYKLR